MKAKKIKLTFEDIYARIEKCEYVIVHTKEGMKPHLLNANDNELYTMPEGYLEYDKRFYHRKY
jgi:hypothetical protein